MSGKSRGFFPGTFALIPVVVHICGIVFAVVFWALFFYLYHLTGNREIMRFLLIVHLPFMATPYMMWFLVNEEFEKPGRKPIIIFRSVLLVFGCLLIFYLIEFLFRLKSI